MPVHTMNTDHVLDDVKSDVLSDASHATDNNWSDGDVRHSKIRPKSRRRTRYEMRCRAIFIIIIIQFDRKIVAKASPIASTRDRYIDCLFSLTKRD